MKNAILKSGWMALAAIAFVGCSDNDSDAIDPNAALYNDVLTNVSTNVIVETYKQLNDKALLLETAIDNLNASRTAENLAAVKLAWQATRQPWESSESFLYGPVDTEEIVDPAIDSWPVDVVAIDNIIASGNAITAASLATNDDARGFHTIEYFIWGISSNKTVDQITNREFEFLQAAAEDLQDNTQKIV